MEMLQDARKVGRGSLTDQDLKRVGSYIAAVIRNENRRERLKRSELNLQFWIVLLSLAVGVAVGFRLGTHFPILH